MQTHWAGRVWCGAAIPLSPKEASVSMSTPVKGSADYPDNHMARLAPVASRLIARLADRAAYATDEEYHELRSLMTSLKALLPGI